MVSGFCKTYNCSFDFAINGISLQNIIMYSKVIPSYIPKEERKKNKSFDNKKVISKAEHNDFLKSLIAKQKKK